LTSKYWRQPKKIENSGNQPVPVQLGSIIVMAQCSTGVVGHSDRLVASTTAVLVMTAIATAN